MNKIHNMKKNAIITFEYSVYNENQELIVNGIEENMIIGKDKTFPNLSNYLVNLDSTNIEHDFNYIWNVNGVSMNVIFNLNVLSYQEDNVNSFQSQNHNNFNNYSNQNETNSTIDKKLKKEDKQLKKEIQNLEKEIQVLKSSEQQLNKKILELSQKAKEQIELFKIEAKKRHETEIIDLKNFQFQSFFEKILSPLNNLYMAVEFGVKQSENPELVGYVKGFELLIDQMFNILNSFGVIIILPKLGDEFNPEFHNIVELVSNKEFKKDKIVEVISRGYELNGRVILAANVKVSKK